MALQTPEQTPEGPVPAHVPLQLRAVAVERPSISWLRNREARWVKPKLSLKVRHLASGSGLLRHATVRGLSEGSLLPDVDRVRRAAK